VRRLIIATALLAAASAALVAPASAQRKPYGAMSDEEKAAYKANEAVDKQYQNAIQRTRKETAEAPADPWANMRGGAAEPPKKKN
jgi:hypothetical protein